MIYRALQRCEELIDSGERNASRIVEAMQRVLGEVAALQVEYISLVDAESLDAVERLNGRVLVAIAARLGSTRLIDNIVVDSTGKQGIIPHG